MTSTKVSFLFLFAILFSIEMRAQEFNWERFESAGSDFSVLVPQGVMTAVETEYPDSTEISQMDYFSRFPAPGGDVELSVFRISYPVRMQSDTLDQFWQSTIEATFVNLEELVYSSNSTYLEYPGYLWRVDPVLKDTREDYNAILVDDTLYILRTVIPSKARNLLKVRDRFFESFTL